MAAPVSNPAVPISEGAEQGQTQHADPVTADPQTEKHDSDGQDRQDAETGGSGSAKDTGDDKRGRFTQVLGHASPAR